MTDHSHDERVRLKAYEIWLGEGQPEGRDQRHWEMAREAIGHEDAKIATLQPSFAEGGGQTSPAEQASPAGPIGTVASLAGAPKVSRRPAA